MRLPILSPDKFAEWFNSVVIGAYRKITTQDVRDLAECGLIRIYGYYGHSDLQTVRAILLYEQMREMRLKKVKKASEPPRCKRCGQPLPSQSDGKKGRPNEYCLDCEPFRARERYLKWWRKREMVPC